MTIEHLIQRHAANSPERIALIEGDVEVSYAALWSNICRAAAWFAARAGRGDRVVLSASKSAGFVYAYFGAHLAGLIAVPIDSETNATRLRRIVDVARPRFVIGELRYGEGLTVVPFDQMVAEPAADFALPDEADVADLLFTTGTTGLPKGVTLTFANQMAAATSINEFIGNSADDVELLALPISHSFGLGRLRCVLSKGGTVVLLGSFASMKRFYAAMDAHGVTGFGMVPASWAYLHKMSGERIGEYADRLRYVEIGSAFMSEADKRLLMRLLPATRICMHYGLTEASRSAFISFHDEEAHLTTAGRPAPGVEIAVYDEQGQPVARGAEGEVCVKGAHVCSGYWGCAVEDFRRDFNGEYFKTGDWGYLDADGYLHLVSRKKELINVGGKKVSPIEVEEALNELEGIRESAAVAMHDDVLGEVVKAYVVCDAPVDTDAAKRALSRRLENYKVPVAIEVIDALPRTANGKLQRLLLADK